jgi:protein kinase-like protein
VSRWKAPFGRYQLIELLGRGGMGEVWRAHDTTIDRVVAIKMLLPHYAQDPEFEQRFRREARTAARLDHPHVVPIHDVGEIDGRLYVTMRLIDGDDLHTLLKTGPLKPERAVHEVGWVGGWRGDAVAFRFQSPPVEPCVRFSRTRLTDALHRRCSISPARPGGAWVRRRCR